MSSLDQSGELDSVIVDVRPIPPCYFPRRYFHALLLFFGIIGSYLLRSVLSVAILKLAPEHNWDYETQGLLMSSYFWGYCVGNLPAAYLIQKYRIKTIVAAGLFVSAISTAVFPFCVFSLPLAITMRVILGLGESVTLPAAFHLVALWFPKREQSSASSFLISASSFGVVLALSFTPLVEYYVDWESIFYMSAAFVFIWIAFWLILFSDRPDRRPFFPCLKVHPIEITTIEMERDEELLKKKFGLLRGDISGAIPWTTLLTHRAVIALLVSHFCHMYGNYLFQNWLPSYLNKQLNFSPTVTGLLADIPYFVSPFILFFSGVIVDFLSIRYNVISLQASRKIFNGLAQVLPAVTMLILGLANPSRSASTLLILISSTSTAFSGGLSGNYLDLSTKYSSILFAYINTIGTIPAFAGIYITGLILDLSHGHWMVVFIVAASLFFFSTLIYSIFGQARRIDFDALSTMPYSSACTGRAEVSSWDQIIHDSDSLIN